MQLTFEAREGLPTEVTLTYRTDHRLTDTGTLTTSVRGASGETLGCSVTRWTGIMLDTMPRALEAAMEAYLYGSCVDDVLGAVKHARDDARAWYLVSRRH